MTAFPLRSALSLSWSRMQRRGPLIALLLASVALLPVACGGDSSGRPLPRATASELRSGLDRVKQNVDAGDCQAAADSALELEQQTADLPSRIDRELRTALQRGVGRLNDLVREQCQAPIDEGATAPATPDTGPTATETTPDEEKQEDKQEKPAKPGKDKKKDENGGTTGPTDEVPPTGNQQGQDFGSGNQDSGGAQP
jgi:hypothetical protein